MKKIVLIEFLRGYSILTIVLYHYMQSLHLQNIGGKLIAFGGTGVHLFVLLSGFGLYYSHLHKPLPYKQFLKKRFTKVYIPYILIVLLSAIVALCIPIYKNSWYAFGGHIFLYKMFDESIMGSYGYPLWFISMIIQFYLVFQGLAYLKLKTTNRTFLIINMILSICWIGFVIYAGKETERVWNSFFIRYVWEFAIGMILADIYNTKAYILKREYSALHYLMAGTIGCLIYGTLALKGGEIGKMTNDIPALLGYSFFAIGIYKLSIKPFNKLIFYTSKISYPLYLIHTLIQLIALHYLGGLSLISALFIALILDYLLSDLYGKSINFVYGKLDLS